MGLIALQKLKDEIVVHKDLKNLSEKQWIDKSEINGVCIKTEKQLNKLIEIYRKKISSIRQQLRVDGEVIKIVKQHEDGRAKTTEEIVSDMNNQLDSANNLAEKEQRLIHKLASCLKEKELRQTKKVVLRSPFNEVNLKAGTDSVDRKVR